MRLCVSWRQQARLLKSLPEFAPFVLNLCSNVPHPSTIKHHCPSSQLRTQPAKISSHTDCEFWPFLIDNHFVLCVIGPNFIATILDSMGTVEAHINVVKTAVAKSAWKEWKAVVGVSGTQNITCDSGIFCIANAAYTIAEHPLTTTMNADFWRTVCWSLIELTKDNKHFATSKASAHLPDRSTPAVSQAVRQTKYDEGLAVLNIIIDGPPNKWWDYWEDKVLT